MSLYLLDTNIWIALARNEPAAIDHLKRRTPAEIASCSVVRAELMLGARKSRRVDENLVGFTTLLAPFRSLPFDDTCADFYGIIRATLEAAGTPVGANDLLIGSIALANDCVLVTRNSREFARIPGIRLEEWSPS